MTRQTTDRFDNSELIHSFGVLLAARFDCTYRRESRVFVMPITHRWSHLTADNLTRDWMFLLAQITVLKERLVTDSE